MFLPRISYGQVKAARLAAIICLVVLTFILMVRHNSPRTPKHNIYEDTEGRTSPWRDWRNKTPVARPDEVLYLTHLAQKHSLTSNIPWFARRIQTEFTTQASRPSMTEVGKNLMGRSDFIKVRADDENLRLRVESAIPVPVGRSPRMNQIDGSDLLFGVSTTYSRLVYADNSLVKDWARWLTDGSQRSNGAGLVLTLNRGSLTEIAAAKEILQNNGIDAVVSAAEGDVAVRYADMVKLLKKENDASKSQGRARKYLGLLDDDIFFPSVGKLLQKLSKFNGDKEYYIGAPSERTDWVFDNDQAFTYGGGAVFLTVPLVDRLSQSTCLKDIIRDDEAGDQWDTMLYNCVSQTGDMELQVLPSFYNPEEEYLFGERGVIENEGYGGGLQALTLHHYKNTHRFEAGQGHLVTDICGEACFLQRFLFRDDWVLVNGYSMTHYPEGVEAMSLKERLRTQDPREDRKTEVSNKVIIDAPERPSDLSVVGWRGRRKTWKLLDSSVRDNGEVWQAYANRRGSGGIAPGQFDDRKKEDIVHEEEERSDLDSLIVLIWEP